MKKLFVGIILGLIAFGIISGTYYIFGDSNKSLFTSVGIIFFVLIPITSIIDCRLDY